MPTWLRVAAGSRPRSRSSAFARIELRQAPLGLARRAASARPPRPARSRGCASRSRTARPSPRRRRARGRRRRSSDSRRPLDRPVVGDVARRLLEVGGQPPALQDLGEHVGDPLAGDVGAADLGDRVVAVADEDALVEARGALALDAVERPLAVRHVAGELLEEQPPQRPRVARVAREQRALDGLRQVDEAEDGPVEVGEMRLRSRRSAGVNSSTGYRTRAIVVILAAGSPELAGCTFSNAPVRGVLFRSDVGLLRVPVLRD